MEQKNKANIRPIETGCSDIPQSFLISCLDQFIQFRKEVPEEYIDQICCQQYDADQDEQLPVFI
jgi:hypothetical protein